MFINDTIKKFEELNANTKEKEKCEKDFLFTIGLPYSGKISNQFSKRLKVVIKNKFNVDINAYYTTLKTGSYFQLNCATPTHLISNVVYKFTCSCDTNITYTGMTTRHLGVRVEEHLHSKKDSAVQKHINVCQSRKNNKRLFENFSILKTCNTQYSTKIQEALLIKKHNPKLNTQVYANGSSFLLNVF